jgi:hypothetical protein
MIQEHGQSTEQLGSHHVRIVELTPQFARTSLFLFAKTFIQVE